MRRIDTTKKSNAFIFNLCIGICSLGAMLILFSIFTLFTRQSNLNLLFSGILCFVIPVVFLFLYAQISGIDIKAELEKEERKTFDTYFNGTDIDFNYYQNPHLILWGDKYPIYIDIMQEEDAITEQINTNQQKAYLDFYQKRAEFEPIIESEIMELYHGIGKDISYIKKHFKMDTIGICLNGDYAFTGFEDTRDHLFVLLLSPTITLLSMAEWEQRFTNQL